MDERVTRRGFLRGLTGVGVLAAATDQVAAQEQTTRISMTDGLVFDPDTAYVPPGGTVIWENVGQIGHSVTAYQDGIPDEAEYFASGDLPSEQAARSAYPDQGEVAGEENFRHTFEVEGTYDYFCIPHESVGMVATLEVTNNPPEQTGYVSILPDSAKTLAVAALSALVTVLVFAWAFMKYGGDYGEGGGGEGGE